MLTVKGVLLGAFLKAFLETFLGAFLEALSNNGLLGWSGETSG
jgi:hypothetical protein